jgi:DnaJ-domain-containing protein 1
MNFAGKLTGMLLGRLLTRNPIGVIAGLLIGHAWDEGWFRRRLAADPGTPPPPKTRTATDPFAILGIPMSATDSEVRDAYRRLISEHHPDKVRARGGSAREIATAERRASDINAAYEKIIAARRT